MKKLLLIVFGASVVLLEGCLKASPPTDFSNLPTIVEVEYPAGAGGNGMGSGLQFFGGGALTYPASDASDTAIVLVNIDSKSTLGSSTSVTVGVISSALSAYNSAGTGLQYVALPDSDYTIIGGTGTIPAGKRLDTVKVVFYPSKIDPTQNFMLPVGISNTSAGAVSGNFGVVYFHTIGNPLAGLYDDVSATRYNYTSATVPAYTYPGAEPPPASTLNLAPYFPKLASPNTPTEITIPYANNLGNYIIDFDASYNLTVTTDVAGITGFTVIYANYDPATKTIHLITGYVNATPAARIVDETMVHE
ncbi:MAG TPA: DUF1735 domain-containing protein [Puia sp.]|jgi:hypothetical protein|nr:DUF1735 domain-containing protein [Puia sp.]